MKKSVKAEKVAQKRKSDLSDVVATKTGAKQPKPSLEEVRVDGEPIVFLFNLPTAKDQEATCQKLGRNYKSIPILNILIFIVEVDYLPKHEFFTKTTCFMCKAL